MKAALAAAAFALAPMAAASAQDRADSFAVEASAVTPAPPDRAYRAFVAVERWWSGEHTYSGDARNLSLSPQPGGCWCERLAEGGFVEHMRVIYAQPGRELRLAGGLGPLQTMGAEGVMVVTFEPEGEGSRVRLVYRVAGPGAGALAQPVSQVLQAQLARYAAAAGAGRG